MIYSAIEKAVSHINCEVRQDRPFNTVHRLEVCYNDCSKGIVPVTGVVKVFPEYVEESDINNHEMVYGFIFERFTRHFAPYRSRFLRFTDLLKEHGLSDKVKWRDTDFDDCDNIPFVKIDIEGNNLICNEMAKALSLYVYVMSNWCSDDEVETIVSTYASQYSHFENSIDSDGNSIPADEFLINRIRFAGNMN